MKRLFLVLFAFLLLTNVSWGSCPSGQEENERTGHCEPVQGARTFETLTEGYCYRYDERNNIYPQFVDLDYCDAWGGVLFDRRDCALKDRHTNGAFCIKAKENENIKKVMAEYLRKKNAVYCYRATPELFYKPTTLRCESGDRRITHQEHLQGRVSDTSTSTASSSGSENVWCATHHGVSKQASEHYCRTMRGISYSSKDQALVEHQRLKEASTSTIPSSGSEKIWCATPILVYQVSRDYCEQGVKGRAYSSEYQAKAEHKRLKVAPTSTASSSSEKMVWCAMPKSSGGEIQQTTESICRFSGGYWSDINKQQSQSASTVSSSGSSSSYSSTTPTSSVYCYKWYPETFYKPSTRRCEVGDNQIARQEYNQKRLKTASTSTASSTNKIGTIWCATKEKIFTTIKSECDALHGKTVSSKFKAQEEHHRLRKLDWVWCATKDRASLMSADHCRYWKGKAYSSEHLAVTEHERLKATSTPAIKTASLTVRSNVKDDKVYIDNKFKGSTRLDLDLPHGKHTIRIEKGGYEAYEETINLTDNLIIRGNLEKIAEKPVQTTTVQTASAEIVFWQSIQDNDDPDLFQAYIDQFPDGVYVSIAKIKIKKLGASEVTKSSIPDLDYGQYHALVIGNNDYAHLPKLKTAVNDADAVTSLLKNKYGFSVKLLKNAKRTDIVSALSAFRRTVSRDDNFLLYYAGHGYLDEAVNEGYWLPVDAERDDPSNWLQNDTIVTQLKGIQAKHVMVVADSCFSGTISRGLKMEQRTPDWLQRMVKKKSRTALTSGGVEPVSDSGGGGHSIFAKYFLSLLEENEEVIDATQLFSRLRRNVVDNSLQTPEYGNIHQAGHDGGDFLFVRR